MTEFTKLEVGKSSPFPAKPNFDGGVFEADQNGFLFLIYLSGMTSKEKRALKNEIIQSRVIRDGERVLTLIKFGVSDLIFELSFDPNLYDDGRAGLINEVNTVQVIGVDSKDNKLQSLRFVTVPKELLSIWRETWEKATQLNNFSKGYQTWLNQLSATRSVVELWNVAKNTGTFGR